MVEGTVRNTADLINEGVLEIGDGYRAKNAEFVPDGGLPFVRVGNVGAGVQLDGLDELPIELRHRYAPKVSRPGDSLITMKGTVGRVAWVRPQDRPFVYAPQISYWRSHSPDVVYPRWLRYWLESPEFGWQASATKGATDMADYINLRDQRRMQITLPPLATQMQIAEVLSSIDDLIENNRRRVEVLEDMARAVYREWFVHFRFPGHEDVTFVDSDFGLIPHGWSIRVLGDLAAVDKGLSYKGAFLTDAGVPMANLKCIAPEGGFRRDGTKPYSGTFKPRHEVRPGDIVIANTDLTQAGNVIGAPAKVPRKGFEDGGIISHHISAIRPHDVAATPWIFRSLEDRRFRDYARSVASGATVLGFRPDDTKAYPVVTPPSSILDGFAETERPMVALQERLLEVAEALSELRNLLLPKLVTGRIDVSDLDFDAAAERAGI